MSATSVITLKREFESRIFVSLGIVVLVCLGSALTGRGAPSSIERIGALVGMLPENSRQAGFLILALHLTCVSVLRMWAGTELSARRVMAFRVQIDEFTQPVHTVSYGIRSIWRISSRSPDLRFVCPLWGC